MARILKEFKITEISACDKPAQAHARMCIMKRHEEGNKMANSYPWMTAAAESEPLDDDAERELTLNRVQRIGREYGRLRQSLLRKNETGANMDDLIQKAGETAEKILELEARELRKLHPELTEAQAFAKVYTDPANIDLRRAEREKNGFIKYVDESEDAPIEISKSEAMAALNVKAAELRKVRPELTEAQAFTKVYTDPANIKLAKAERNGSRALLGV